MLQRDKDHWPWPPATGNEAHKAHGDETDAPWRCFRRKGLCRTILFWFLALSVLPLTLVSVISYRDARDRLEHLSLDTLIAAAEFSAEQIRHHFDRVLLDLKQQSEARANIQFLAALESAYTQSGLAGKAFVATPAWARIVNQHAADLRTFRNTYAYEDVLLADLNGNILFTVAGQQDLGASLFSAPLDHTRLAAAARQALDSGRPVFSDFEHYAPMNNDISGFLVKVLTDDAGEKIGLIILNIPSHPIDAIMQHHYIAYDTSRTYLVGDDMRLRSRWDGLAGDAVLTRRIDTQPMQALIDKHAAKGPGECDVHQSVIIYRGPAGRTVLGVHRHVEIAGVDWAVVAEIETSEALAQARDLGMKMSGLLLGTIVLVILITIPLMRRNFRPLQTLSAAAAKVADGDLEQTISIGARNEIGELADRFNQMVASLKAAKDKARLDNWAQKGRADLSDCMRGELEVAELSTSVITLLCRYLKADTGTVFSALEKDDLQPTGWYGRQQAPEAAGGAVFGQALAERAARQQEMVFLSNPPDDLCVGARCLVSVLAVPLVYEARVEGVVALGFMVAPGAPSIDFLRQSAESITLAFRVARSRSEMKELLEKTQLQARELAVREEALRANNALLETQKAEIEEKNVELERTKADLERKAEELATAGKYKSQFLANMSHELRTPLNSLLILSKMLSENDSGNLTPKQQEYAQTINDAGNGLLNLINDILDLSKIEAGHMSIEAQPLELERLIRDVHSKFDVLAGKRGLAFSIQSSGLEGRTIVTDIQKLHQILNNLLSNAFKFTSSGAITMSVAPADRQARLSQSGLSRDQAVCFKVSDTGIGIEPQKQQLIFEAFQQEDGSTSRKYGGTGLGLSISRELALLLGGEIQLHSEKGKGSQFFLYLPLEIQSGSAIRRPPAGAAPSPAAEPENDAARSTGAKVKPVIRDDRDRIKPGDRTVLIIEDEPLSARIVANFAKTNGFKYLLAGDGETGLLLAEQYLPGGILLDIGLPGIDGWEVMARLKDNMKTRHIPVHFVSASERQDEAAIRGAVGYLNKPVNLNKLRGAFTRIEHVIDKEKKDLLVISADERQARGIKDFIGHDDLAVTIAATATEAFQLLAVHPFDCIVLDQDLPDMPVPAFFEKLRIIEKSEHIPVVVYIDDEMDPGQRAALAKLADSILVKGPRSPERLLDETALFLHRIASNLPKEKRRMVHMLHDPETVLRGKTVLIVDDDMRNVYALSQILQKVGVNVLVGKDGKQGVAKLFEHPETDLVLMDITMPEWDGYEAMRHIRRKEAYSRLPIIALTAKAMKEDRARCLEAGASDYIAKPVDAPKLLSVLRVWMDR